MTRRQALLLGAAGVCAALAAVLALLSRDVGRWHQAVRAGDVAAATGARGSTWSVKETLPAAPARAALGIGDDIAFRRDLELFRQAFTRDPELNRNSRAAHLRVRAEAALAHDVRTDPNKPRASAAGNLLGILAYVDAAASRKQNAPVDRAILELKEAIHLDVRNDDAKANLELMYRQTEQSYSVRGIQQLQRAANAQASASAPGHGY